MSELAIRRKRNTNAVIAAGKPQNLSASNLKL